MERREEIQARRRILVRVGLGSLLLATVTACIFEKSDYPGGGRVDHGGDAKTAEPPASSSQPTAQPTTPPTSDGAVLDPFDSGAGAG